MSDFDDLHLWIGGLMVAIALLMSACGATRRCDVPVSVRFEPEPALPIVAIRCRDRVLWREPCPSAVVRRDGYLWCAGERAVRLPGSVTEAAQ